MRCEKEHCERYYVRSFKMLKSKIRCAVVHMVVLDNINNKNKNNNNKQHVGMVNNYILMRMSQIISNSKLMFVHILEKVSP